MSLFFFFIVSEIRRLFSVNSDVPLFTILANEELPDYVDAAIGRVLKNIGKCIVLIPDDTPVGNSVGHWCTVHDVRHCARGWNDKPNVQVGRLTGKYQPRVKNAQEDCIYLADKVYVMRTNKGYDDNLKRLVKYARAQGKHVEIIHVRKNNKR